MSRYSQFVCTSCQSSILLVPMQ